MKKLFLLFVAFVATTCLWAEDFSVDGIYYNYLEDNNVEVTYQGRYYNSYDNEYSGAVSIPSTVTSNGTTYSVTSIGGAAFRDCSSLISITIPESVTSIGGGAFLGTGIYNDESNWENNVLYISNCLIDAEESISGTYTIKENTRLIAADAFYRCSSLTSVTIPNSVTSIGKTAFEFCFSLTSITIPNSVTSIGYRAFYRCSSLTSITIPNSVTSIGEEAFSGCSSLTSMTVEKGNTLYDSRENCNAIIATAYNTLIAGCQNTVIPNSVTSIGNYAFSDCSSLTSVTIPNSVTSIGEWAFYYCTSLTSITIPNSVTSIGEEAFRGCSSLTSITIPESVTSIGELAFYNTGIYNNESNWEDNVFYIDNCLIEANTSISGSYTIKENTRLIADYAFYNCRSLTSITIPNSVTSIGDVTFYNCSSLTSITIPNSVTIIGNSAFAYCSSLASVTIGTNVTTIGSSAFYGCDAITSITWNPKYYADFSHSTPFYKPEQISSFTFGDAVEHIPAYLCSGMIKLTSITIPNSVTSIGERAFSDCISLTSITIPNSVTSIGAYAFAYSEALTSITIPNSVKSIGRGAFQGVQSLNKTICSGDIASWCNIEFDGMFANPITYSHNLYINDQEVKSLVIPNSVTSIGNCAFSGCYSLTSIIIPNSVTSIGDYAFGGCTFTYDKFINNSSLNAKTNNYWSATIVDSEIDGLLIRNDTLIACRPHVTSAILPNSVTSIGDWAFKGCSSLTSVTIPNSVTSIGSGAFAYCYSLTSIYWNANRCTDFISYSDAPFFAISSQITSFNFGDSVNYIPAYLCHGMNRLASITIGSNVQELADSVFYNCNRIDTIRIKALTPPVLRENVFSSKAICEIPCVSLHHYELSPWKEYAYSFETDPFNQSFLVQSNNDKMGVVDIVQYPDCGIPAIIKTVPVFGHRFVQWNDGNTDSLRTIFIDKDTCLVAEFALSYSGQCGENLYWSYDNSKLNINGSGTMNHFESTDKPWLLFNDSIITIDISLGATTIGKNAFADQIKLNTVILPYTLEDIGDKAFDGCRRLYNIYCYAAIPPIAELTSFMNYNAQLYIPCEALELYKSDMVFGEFDNLHCINADTQPVAPDTIIVTPGTTDVTITWPTEDNAYQYVIEIKKDGEVFCTLTFNSEGQLLNIAFAPGRKGTHSAQYAAETANGLRFTVTGLEEGTHYTYDVITKDKEDNQLSAYSGEFTTYSNTPSNLENLDPQSPKTDCQKLLRDGQLIIVRDGIEYNAIGQEL